MLITTYPSGSILSIYFLNSNLLILDIASKDNILSIIKQAQIRCGILTDKGVNECIADYAKNGRDAIKILQSAMNLVRMEGRPSISIDDAKWVIASSRYIRTKELYTKDGGKIIDISLIKPLN